MKPCGMLDRQYVQLLPGRGTSSLVHLRLPGERWSGCSRRRDPSSLQRRVRNAGMSCGQEQLSLLMLWIPSRSCLPDVWYPWSLRA